MMRVSVWSVLAMCSATPCRCGGESDDASWTFAFVVAADCPAPTETRRGLDAVARQVVQLGRRLSQHNVVLLHSPATSAPPYLTVTRRGMPSVRSLGNGSLRDPRASVRALTDALKLCPARHRAFFFVGHTEEDARDRAPNRLGLPLVISALAEWARTTSVEPFDLVLLHCCYSARIETIMRLAPSARWLAVSESWIHPQDLDYRVLRHAVDTDDGHALAQRLIPTPGRRPERPQFLVFRADRERLSTFHNGLNSFADVLRRAVQLGSLDPLEIGHLHEPVEGSLVGRVDVTALLGYASNAHWLPREARESALAAGKALRDLVALPKPETAIAKNTQPVITVGFPWHEPHGSEAWQAYRMTPFAGTCRWPQFVADAKRLANRQGGLFMGWELERALIGR